MFSEFFLRAGLKTTCVAWGGLITVLGYSMFLAWIKARINDFYSDFYDLMQASGTISGDYGSGDGPSLPEYRARVWEQLARFAGIVAPLVMASPAAKWARSAWALAWRLALMKGYLKAWDIAKEPIEGASQRLHEDTQRFCNALQGCLATLLDAVFTLAVFTPILFDLSARVAPPLHAGPFRCVWLWLLALAAAFVGLGGAAFFGQKLVGLEVNNQRVEAALRKDLVLLEATPAAIVGVPCPPVAPDDDDDEPTSDASLEGYSPWCYFMLTLRALSRNYHALFRHFSLLNFWLSLFDQTMVIFPYVVAAPLLFADDPKVRITLGTLVKMSNSFDKVFSSFSVIAENWGAINEFRSVLRRLREFEARLYRNQPSRPSSCLLATRDQSDDRPPPPRAGGAGHPRARGRSEARSHTRTSSGGNCGEVLTAATELIVVDGGPVHVQTTYGASGGRGHRGGGPSDDSRYDMDV